MLSIFRTNQLLFSILLVGYAALLRGSVFLAPEQWEVQSQGILSDWVFSLTGHTGWLPDLLALLLVFIHGVLLNSMNLNHRLADQVSLFPGLFYILFASILPEFLHLSPLHLANTFYILALIDLMAVYNQPRSAGYIFNAGLWIGLGSLFHFSYLAFFFLGFVALNILRAFDIRERLMVLLGIVTPYVLVALYYFWNDQFEVFFQQQFLENLGFLNLQMQGAGLMDYSKLGLFVVLLLIALFSQNQYVFRKVIQVQKKINILFWGMLIAGLAVFFHPSPKLDYLLTLVVPLGVLLSINFINMPRNWAEFFHFLLLITALFFQYQPLLVRG